MLIMNRKDLETFIESDSLREFIMSASDYELGIIESALRCFEIVGANVSHTDRNNKVTALTILKSVEGAREQQQDLSPPTTENIIDFATEVAKDQE